jgi:biopolymer transport protein ExbD
LRRRDRKIKVGTLNLAALIDIQANLLFFLIISASVQEDRLKAGVGIELPSSSSLKAEAGDLVSIVVSLTNITVNEKEVCKLNAGKLETASLDDKNDSRIIPLYTTLTVKFQDLVAKGAQPGAQGDDDSKIPVVLIQADKRLPYETLKRVMRTCGTAGFAKFRFATKGGGKVATEDAPAK